MKNMKLLIVGLLTSGFLLSACSNAPKQSSEKGSTPVSENSQGDNPSTPSQGGESQGGSSQGGASDSQGGSSSAKQDNLKTLQELKETIAHHFHFEYYPNSSLTENTFNTSEIVKYATDGTYTASYELMDRLWINIGGRSHQYQRGSSGTFLELASPTTEVVTVAEGAAEKTMLAFHDSVEYTKKENTNFLNRAATKYTLEVNEGSMQQGQFHTLFTEVIIDNATGLALRHYSRQSGNMNLKTLPINFELAALNLGNDADAFIATKTAKIGVYDWDTNFYSSMGLTTVARPNEEFWYANRVIGTSYDDFAENIQTIFRFAGTKDATVAKGKALVESFYNAGLKYDSEHNLAPTYNDNSIYYEDLEEGNISFDGYTSEGHYVDFDLDYIDNAATPYLRVVLDFYKVA